MSKSNVAKRTLGGIVMTFALVGGLLATTRLAGAETGSGDLSGLLDRKLAASRIETPVTKSRPATSTAPTEPADPLGTAGTFLLVGLGVAAAILLVAFWAKRSRERRFGEALGDHLAVKESVWIGRGQRVLLLTFENHKVLVGVSNGAIHNLGIFGEGEEPVAPSSPIERAAAQRGTDEKNSSDFSDFVKGELAEGFASLGADRQDRRRRMITELNTL